MIKGMIERANLANITAVFIVMVGLSYAVMTNDAKLVSFIVGAGITWLFNKKNTE